MADTAHQEFVVFILTMVCIVEVLSRLLNADIIRPFQAWFKPPFDTWSDFHPSQAKSAESLTHLWPRPFVL